KPMRSDDGTVTGYVGTVEDITARRRAEEALRDSEARKSAILETSLDGIVTIDGEGRILEFNPTAERMFGYARECVVGREMAELLIPPSLRDRHRDGLRRNGAGAESGVLGKRIEITAMRADGTQFPVELAVTRIGENRSATFTG